MRRTANGAIELALSLSKTKLVSNVTNAMKPVHSALNRDHGARATIEQVYLWLRRIAR